MNDHVCRECGAPITYSGRGQRPKFCSPAHRKAWNNRRMVRGAELYDLVMALRYERERANAKGAFSIMANLARAYRDSDNAKREGRLSWNLDETIAALPLAFSWQGDKR